MRCAIIPVEKLPVFDRSLTDYPHIRTGPVMIYSGAHAGNYAINEAILDSCDEWRAAAPRCREIQAEHGIVIIELNALDLKNPDSNMP